MAVFEWWGEVEFLAELDRKDLNEYAEGASIAHYNSVDMVLRLSQRLDAVEYEDAMAEAQAWVADLAVTKLAAAGRAAGPVRFTIESQIARSKNWAVGTKEAAELLGLSTARLRQLEAAGKLPEPVSGVEAAGGRVWRTDEIEAYAANREPGRPGRPRKETP